MQERLHIGFKQTMDMFEFIDKVAKGEEKMDFLKGKCEELVKTFFPSIDRRMREDYVGKLNRYAHNIISCAQQR